MDGKRILVVYTNKNDPRLPNDAGGAFIPEAMAFAKLHKVPETNMLGVPCPGMPAGKRREAVCDFFRGHTDGKIEMIAWFGHGYSTGIQFGFNIQTIPQLVEYMKLCCADDVSMIFYACSTGSTNKKTRAIKSPGTNNGFADKVRDYMLWAGFRGGWIDGHLKPGHTTLQPFLLRFYVEPMFEGIWDVPGGEWIISPKGPLWKKWRDAIQTKGSTFKFLIPFAAQAEIMEMLS